MSNDYYPESLGNMLIVNVPWVFSAVWAICKAFIDEKTRTKIRIIGKDKSLATLEEFVEKSNIPDFFGGDCKCEGGCLSSNFELGPWSDYEVAPGNKQVRRIQKELVY